MDTLTATKVIAAHKQAQRLKHNAVEYKRFVKQLMETYRLEKSDAFRIATGEDLLEITAKYERKD